MQAAGAKVRRKRTRQSLSTSLAKMSAGFGAFSRAIQASLTLNSAVRRADCFFSVMDASFSSHVDDLTSIQKADSVIDGFFAFALHCIT